MIQLGEFHLLPISCTEGQIYSTDIGTVMDPDVKWKSLDAKVNCFSVKLAPVCVFLFEIGKLDCEPQWGPAPM